MYALVDCNNFYCSCERLFNPRLGLRPIVVLSNNDGCAISRNDAAKRLGIAMGTPAFMLQDMVQRHNIAVFSSNYTLYGDMSARVMGTLATFCNRMECYSIDEAFLDLHGMARMQLSERAVHIRQTVKQHTGIPVSVGIAPTKTLAKMANRYAKRHRKDGGVFAAATDELVKRMLQATPIEDVWGIGRRRALFLQRHGLKTAADFAAAPEEWIRVHMTVTGQRLLNEVRGVSSIPWEEEPPAKQTIAHARSFGRLLTARADIAQALANYAAHVAEKLRRQSSNCRQLLVFIQTNPHRTERPQYMRSVNVKLPVATNNTSQLIRSAVRGLEQIFQPGHQYMKAGLVAIDLVPAGVVQQSLFDEPSAECRQVMSAMDGVNAGLGKEIVRMGSQGFQRPYALKAEYLSPKYTTRMTDIIKVKN